MLTDQPLLGVLAVHHQTLCVCGYVCVWGGVCVWCVCVGGCGCVCGWWDVCVGVWGRGGCVWWDVGRVCVCVR